IVKAFLDSNEARGKVTSVGVLGLSFGGIQALVMAEKAREGKLPFELSGCLALSPPVKLLTSARVVDGFFANDRWQTTMIELAKRFGSHVPVADGVKVPFEAKDMRAAIGFVFRDGLSKV